MSPLEALLIVLVILLILYVASPGFKAFTTDCVDSAKDKLGLDRMAAEEPAPAAASSGNADSPVSGVTASAEPAGTPEQRATAENIESFASCRSADDQMQRELNCMCDGQADFSYAVNEFGAPGMDYKDWVAAQTVDPSVVKNHAEFVSDRARLREGNILGKTWTPDMHMSYDPISWAGLRRPQAVAVCNPTQVPDVDYNLYNTESTFNWRSGSGALH